MIKPLLNTECFSRLSLFNRLIVGFSGGLDSTVLLHALASRPALFTKLVAVHVNHGISVNAHLWQTHCEQFCRNLGIHLVSQRVQFDRSANIEEGARIARYEVFSSLMTVQDCLVLGHHLDDQAETVLLQLFRGAGVDGLSAMAEFSQLRIGGLFRPFLSHQREQLEHYADVHQLSWIEDESNQDISYSRNYLRQQIMPLLKRKWPGIVGNIARTTVHCQQAKRNLDVLATIDFSLAEKNLGALVAGDHFSSPPTIRSFSVKSRSLSRTPEPADNPRDVGNTNRQHSLSHNSLFIELLQGLSLDRIANILRVWLKNNQVQLPSTVTFRRLIDELIYASHDAVPEVSWGTVLVRRYQKHLYLDRKNENILPSYIEWSKFPVPLTLGNTGINLLAKKTNQGLVIPLDAKIFVKFRQGGEEFSWHGQTKRLKKLFQEWEVPPWLRERIPLVYFNESLAAVVGYAMSDLFFTNEASDAWFFNCIPC